jgi:hypothetical protein
VKSVIGLSGADIVELGVYSAFPSDDGLNAKVIGFAINVNGSQHRIYIACVFGEEDWSRLRASLPNLLNKVRWRNYKMFYVFIGHALSVMIDNFLNEDGGDIYENALQQVMNLLKDFENFEAYRSRCREEPFASIVNEVFRRSFFLQALEFAEALTTGLFLNLITGNIPSCFSQLRLVLESLAEALIIDYRYGLSDERGYIEKCMDICMHRLDGKRRERCIKMCKEQSLYRKYILWRKVREKEPTTRVFMKQLATIIGEENAEKVTMLWNKLSSEWIHFTGYAKDMSKPWIPPYTPALVAFIDNTQMKASKELAKAVATLRKLICAMINAWLVRVEEYNKDIAKCFTRCEIPEEAEYIETAH